MVCPRRASWTTCSISHLAAPTTQEDGTMISTGASPTGDENWRDKASGLVFREQGLYVRVKLNLPRKSAHRAWRRFSLWAEHKYAIFYDQPTQWMGVLHLQASVSTPAGPTRLQAAHDFLHCNSTQLERGIWRKRLRGGVYGQREIAGRA